MKLVVSRRAARQLENALGYIHERNPQAASKVQGRIQQMMHLVLQSPFAGQATSISEIRRVVAVPYPYAIFYEVADDELMIHSIRHTSRKPIA